MDSCRGTTALDIRTYDLARVKYLVHSYTATGARLSLLIGPYEVLSAAARRQWLDRIHLREREGPRSLEAVAVISRARAV